MNSYKATFNVEWPALEHFISVFEIDHKHGTSVNITVN